MPQTELFTIGHSTLATEQFVQLIRQHNIEHVADVRSTPYSRRVPHFNREALTKSFNALGISYSFMGDGLGGRPKDNAHYGHDGRANYQSMSRSQQFKNELSQLAGRAADTTTAILCSEQNPIYCHRTLLVGHELSKQGLKVRHILPTGKIQEHGQLVAGLLAMMNIAHVEPGQTIDPKAAQQAVNAQANKVAYKR